MYVQKLSSNALLPTMGSRHAAGYDLYAVEDVILPPHGKALVCTGLAIELPFGTYGRIAPRSGLASKFFIDIGAGVIDADYRGELKVLMFNHSNTVFNVSMKDRIAQLIIEKIENPEVVEVDALDYTTERGKEGFGSTGMK